MSGELQLVFRVRLLLPTLLLLWRGHLFVGLADGFLWFLGLHAHGTGLGGVEDGVVKLTFYRGNGFTGFARLGPPRVSAAGRLLSQGQHLRHRRLVHLRQQAVVIFLRPPEHVLGEGVVGAAIESEPVVALGLGHGLRKQVQHRLVACSAQGPPEGLGHGMELRRRMWVLPKFLESIRIIGVAKH